MDQVFMQMCIRDSAVGDGKSQDVKLKNKKVVTVTQGNYRSLIASSDNATDRKKIFEAVFKTCLLYTS